MRLADLSGQAGYADAVLASERVQEAIVLLAAGGVGRLKQAIDLVRADRRDMLAAAGLADDDWPTKLDRGLGAEQPSYP